MQSVENRSKRVVFGGYCCCCRIDEREYFHTKFAIILYYRLSHTYNCASYYDEGLVL